MSSILLRIYASPRNISIFLCFCDVIISYFPLPPFLSPRTSCHGLPSTPHLTSSFHSFVLRFNLFIEAICPAHLQSVFRKVVRNHSVLFPVVLNSTFSSPFLLCLYFRFHVTMLYLHLFWEISLSILVEMCIRLHD